MIGQARIKTICPRDCYDSCGIVAIKREGKPTQILGDPDDQVARGGLCGKCAIAYNGVWQDPAKRLLKPLRRIGAKGEGLFEPMEWDQALSLIAARLGRILVERGGASVLSAHYTGTCSVVANGFPNRFFNVLGATEVDPDTICNNAGHIALHYVMGTSAVGFDPRTAKDAQSIMLWGVNPAVTAPHAHRYWLAEAKAKVIVIDPVRTETAARADLHLQLRPGSDAALAYAMLHVLIRDSMTDKDFIERNVVGWAEVESVAAECSPAWGEEQTGVPADLIERAAHEYGAGPALLWLGQGLQRQPNGGNVFRAAAMLPAATGNFGKAGAGLYYLNGKVGTRGMKMAAVAGSHLRKGPARAISHMDLAEALADPARASSLFVWNMNIAASAPNQAKLRDALAREDLFTVVVDLFATDTTRYADFVLPAASFLEFDDLVGSYFHLNLGAQVKVSDPLGDALPNQEIFRRLARAMNLQESALFESDAEIMAPLLEQFRTGLTFAELAQSGPQLVSSEPIILHRDLRFATDSGKIELASKQAERNGHGRIPWPQGDFGPAPGKLRLLSPASRWLMNSSYGNDPRIRSHLAATTVRISPRDANRRGIVDGQKALIRNDAGQQEVVVVVDPLIQTGMALMDKSRWPSESGGQNVNFLHPGIRTDMGDSNAVHGVEVELMAIPV